MGHQDALPGVLSNDPFRIVGLKKPDYSIVMACACGSLVRFDGARENARTVGDSRTRFQ